MRITGLLLAWLFSAQVAAETQGTVSDARRVQPTAGGGDLVPAALTQADHDLTVSIVTAQLRYRWEVAPLPDIFLVYNLGNSLPNQFDSTFDDLFSDVLDEPVIESFVANIRW